MKHKTCIFTVFAAALFALAAFSQTPPPNDNYSNSITLTGTDITFSGTLAGATIEDAQETSAYYGFFNSGTATQSVWWNWTAPTDTVLTLQILNPDPWFAFPSPGLSTIAVYSATNGSSSPAGLVLPPLGLWIDYSRIQPRTLSVPVTGGSTYQIQLIGNTSANYNFRLLATNTPVIVKQPRSQTVYSNASALFYVVYSGAGQTNFTFQWFLNGTNLPGETAPMLALTNIDSSMAGTYTVAVSNSAGATLSAPATLTVSQSNYPVVLNPVGFAVTNCLSGYNEFLSNAFCFTVDGESGRTYRLQSSTDLKSWSFENDFDMMELGGLLTTSAFFQTNASQLLASPAYTYPRYYRVMPYVIGDPHAAICINNQRQIRIAKLLWGRDYDPSLRGNPTPTDSDLAVYFPHHTLPFCPDDPSQTFDTSYFINDVETFADCKIIPWNHILIDPP